MKKIKVIQSFFSIIWFSLHLSLSASKIYSISRLLLKLIMAGMPTVMAFCSKMIVDQMVIRNNYKTLILWIFGFAVILVLNGGLNKLNEYITNIHNLKLQNYISLLLSRKSISLDLQFFDSMKFYNTMENSRKDAFTVIGIIWNIIDGFSAAVTLGIAFVIIFNLNWILACLLLLFSVPSFLINQKYTKIKFNWDKENVILERKYGYIYQILTAKQYAKDIRFYDLGEYLHGQYIRYWEIWFNGKKEVIKKRFTNSLVPEALPTMLMFFILVILGGEIYVGEKSIGDFSFYSSQIQQLNASFTAFIIYCVGIYDNKLRINNVKNFLEIENQMPVGERLIDNIEYIEFRNVSFVYPGTKKIVLDNVSFRVNKGEKIAIVGLNGSGKTSIVKLLMRFYICDGGQILINGIDINKLDLKSYRKHISVFFQDYINYAFSLKENIIFGRVDDKNNDEKYKWAISKANLSELIEELPEGERTYLSRIFDENGIELSIGQEQKVAMAKTFFRDGDLFLLDEPSAALDPEAEFKIFSILNSLPNDKTVIFISHRLSNIRIAERIIVLENGKIIETGSHNELINIKGRYFELYNYQMSKYGDEKYEEN